MQTSMDWWQTLALGLGSAWISGMRLYAVVATLGWLGYGELVKLPGELTVLTNPWVFGVATALFVVEFLADKISYVDSAWDAVHSFIRIPAGAVLATLAFTEYDPAVQVVACLIGGGLAFTSHAGKATVRAAVNASPEPFSNVAVSGAEDVVSGASMVMVLLLPIVALFVLGALVLITWLWLPRAWRAIRQRMRPNAAAPPKT